jgi:hypothetical protein
VLIEYGQQNSKDVLDNPAAAGEKALRWIVSQGLLEPCTLHTSQVRTLRPAYVVNREPGTSPTSAVEQCLVEHGVRLAGRYGTWDYLSMEESFLSGAKAAEAALATDATDNRVARRRSRR